jgi:pimeloyl-ACP methyl ester carboxylesterase
VHGFTGDSSHFEFLASQLVKRGIRVLRPDNIGRGYSECKGAPHTAELFVRHIRALLLSLNLDGQQFFLVGYSMGGVIAAHFTASYPELVKGLILISSAGLLELPTAVRVIKTVPLLPEIIVGSSVRSILMDNFDDEWEVASGPNYERVKSVYAERIHNEPALARSMVLTIRSFPFSDSRSVFECVGRTKSRPILILWGDRDKTCPFENALELHRFQMPHARLVTVQNGRHAALLERPDEFSVPIGDFIHESSK